MYRFTQLTLLYSLNNMKSKAENLISPPLRWHFLPPPSMIIWMGEARAPTLPLLRNDCSPAPGTTFWQRTNSGKLGGLRNRLGEISECFCATSEACRRVSKTRWRRIYHLLTAGARLNARTSEKGARARAHPNCAVPTLDAAHRKCKRGSNESYATSKLKKD